MPNRRPRIADEARTIADMLCGEHRKDAAGEKTPDVDRFSLAVGQITGKRLTYAELTGKVGETQN